MDWLIEKTEKTTIYPKIDKRIEKVLTTYIALHNAQVDDVDHINESDVVEDALKLFLRNSLHIDDDALQKKQKKQNLKPVYIDDYRTPRGRAQAREFQSMSYD
ncbi:hypothetical protein ERL59_06585 [Chengkuizengella sp. YPA3-1-1]|uniref:Uncharacterized protein n=2 Tax=Chengkuizengella marina TaxID=2507566 RepID=A0A6N9Q2L4_9BACL|nr:hypothetical protein [Chengkuizengella marina]